MPDDLTARARERAENAEHVALFYLRDFRHSQSVCAAVRDLRALADDRERLLAEAERLKHYKTAFDSVMPTLILLKKFLPGPEVQADVKGVIDELCSHVSEAAKLRDAFVRMDENLTKREAEALAQKGA